MRPVAICRKNWLFVGSVEAGYRSAVLMSLIASCKANEVEPWAYLKDIFTRLPQGLSEDELRSLLPDIRLTAPPTKMLRRDRNWMQLICSARPWLNPQHATSYGT
jgi:hypothetical protein